MISVLVSMTWALSYVTSKFDWIKGNNIRGIPAKLLWGSGKRASVDLKNLLIESYFPHRLEFWS